MKFYELAIGARFVFRGRRFEKIAMSMANNEHGHGSIIMGETEVVPDGAPLLLPVTGKNLIWGENTGLLRYFPESSAA
jgi:hypothetical protein